MAFVVDFEKKFFKSFKHVQFFSKIPGITQRYHYPLQKQYFHFLACPSIIPGDQSHRVAKFQETPGLENMLQTLTPQVG